MNSEQKEAYEGILERVKSYSSDPYNKNNFYIRLKLDGPGGTGKSYVIKNVCKKFRKRNYEVLAPTNKAADILINDGINAITIAKYLGWSTDVDENGKIITRYKFDGINDYTDMIIVDECSMVSEQQIEILNTIRCPIVYIGDDCQLPPVGEKSSKVYDIEFNDKWSLVKNMRTNSVELNEFIIEVRNSVINNRLRRNLIGTSLYVITDEQKYINKAVELFRKNEETIMLSWTNSKTSYYSQAIRERLFYDKVKDLRDLEKYYPGEQVIITKFFKSYPTSTKALIEKVEEEDIDLEYPKCICKENKETNKCDKCKTKSYKYVYRTIKFYKLTANTGSNREPLIFMKPYNDRERRKLEEVLIKYKDQCKERKSKVLWKQYYEMRDKYNSPFEYSYSTTVHKSQGSGYDNVFVDHINIHINQDVHERLRLLYVAVSRTKKNLYILN